MIIILSPSKTIGKINPAFDPKPSQPQFLAMSETLIEKLRSYGVDDLQELMGVSQSIARLNVERFLQWETPFNKNNSTPALLCFKGDVYEGINVKDFSDGDFSFAQDRLRILSGLYGTLRPLDLMQPYRLEMGTKISVANKKNLYGFWKTTLTEYLNRELQNDNENTLVNLASNEYSKTIDLKALKGQIITPIFKEQKGSEYKTVAIYAKRARGLITRFVIKNRIKEVDHLKLFTDEGYIFSSEHSHNSQWVFIR